METGQGAGGANGQGDGQQQGGEGADSGPDFAAMQQALSSQGETLESMRDFLQSAPWQDIQQAQGQEAPQQDDPFGELDLGILDPDVAAGMDPQQFSQQLSQTMLQAAGQLAEQMGQPELGQNPKFWRVVYMAGRAADAAAEEQGDISAPAGLESGAGATPGGGGGDLGDQIVGARAGRGVLPF
jgi:hypothetical protein